MRKERFGELDPSFSPLFSLLSLIPPSSPAFFAPCRFGESSAKKMLAWTLSHLPPTPSFPTVLDLGCGNGDFLFRLASRKAGYHGALLTGVDYSQGSVDLARLIGQAKASGEGRDVDSRDEDSEDDESEGSSSRAEGSEGDVKFEHADVLNGEDHPGGPWDLV